MFWLRVGNAFCFTNEGLFLGGTLLYGDVKLQDRDLIVFEVFLKDEFHRARLIVNGVFHKEFEFEIDGLIYIMSAIRETGNSVTLREFYELK